MARRYVNTATPSSPEEMAELLADPAAAAKALGGDWSGFHAAYAEAAGSRDPSVAIQVKEAVQIELANFLKSDAGRAGANGKRLDLAPGGASARNALHSKKAPGVAVDGIFDSLGEMVAAIHPKADPSSAKLGQLRNAMSSSQPSAGGFLVPETFRSDVLAASLETAVVRPRATVIPMGSSKLSIPTIDDTSHASSVYGGLIGAWSEESAQLAITDPKFARVALEAKKLTIYSEAPSELVDDAPAFNAVIQRTFPAAAAWFEDSAFVSGTGVGEPEGFLNAPAAVTVTKETSQVADTIVIENLSRMVARLLPNSLARSVWIANVNVFHELATMALSVGTGGGPSWISSFSEAAPMTIFGRPVIFTEHAPTLGDAGDISLVDLSFYLIGDRQQMELRVSDQFKFRNDELAIRLIERCDGRLWITSAITPANGPDALSPVVKLGARA